MNTSRYPRLLLASVAMLATASHSLAYSDDTHYALTYYLARHAGYTPEQAYRIASANVQIDYSPETEPIQTVLPSGRAHYVRSKYHAMLDQSRFPGAVPAGVLDLVDKALKTRTTWSDLYQVISSALLGGNALFSSQYKKAVAHANNIEAGLFDLCASSLRNPGPYLHFVQDSYSHAGYGTTFGHYHPENIRNSGASVNGYGLPFGSITDYLAYDPPAIYRALRPKTPIGGSAESPAINRNRDMAIRTLGELRRFAQVVNGSRGLAPELPAAEAMLMIEALKAANPLSYSLRMGLEEFFAGLVEDANSPSWSNLKALCRSIAEPRLAPALAKIRDGMAARFEDQIPDVPLPYTFRNANFPLVYLFKLKSLKGDMETEFKERLDLYGKIVIVPPNGAKGPFRYKLFSKTYRKSQPEVVAAAGSFGRARSEGILCPAGDARLELKDADNNILQATFFVRGGVQEVQMHSLSVYARTTGPGTAELVLNCDDLGLPRRKISGPKVLEQPDYKKPRSFFEHLKHIDRELKAGDGVRMSGPSTDDWRQMVKVSIGGKDVKVLEVVGSTDWMVDSTKIIPDGVGAQIKVGLDQEALRRGGDIIVQSRKVSRKMGRIVSREIAFSYQAQSLLDGSQKVGSKWVDKKYPCSTVVMGRIGFACLDGQGVRVCSRSPKPLNARSDKWPKDTIGFLEAWFSVDSASARDWISPDRDSYVSTVAPIPMDVVAKSVPKTWWCWGLEPGNYLSLPLVTPSAELRFGSKEEDGNIVLSLADRIGNASLLTEEIQLPVGKKQEYGFDFFFWWIGRAHREKQGRPAADYPDRLELVITPGFGVKPFSVITEHLKMSWHGLGPVDTGFSSIRSMPPKQAQR